jgi:hypothetical protein
MRVIGSFSRTSVSSSPTEKPKAHDGHALGAGPAEAGADGGRQRVAERAVSPVGDEAAAGGALAPVGGEIGTGCAGIGDDDGVLRQHGLEIEDDALGTDRRRVALRERQEACELLPSGALDGIGTPARWFLAREFAVQGG